MSAIDYHPYGGMPTKQAKLAKQLAWVQLQLDLEVEQWNAQEPMYLYSYIVPDPDF